MNQVIEGLKDEYIERLVQMVTRYGVPQGAERFGSTEKLRKYISENGLDGRIAKSDAGEIAGFILFCMGYLWPLDVRRFNKSTEVGYISDIIVNPEFQCKGIGSTLVKAAETELAKMGARRVTLITSDSNQKAQAFFKKLGYIVSGKTDVVGFEKAL